MGAQIPSCVALRMQRQAPAHLTEAKADSRDLGRTLNLSGGSAELQLIEMCDLVLHKMSASTEKGPWVLAHFPLH